MNEDTENLALGLIFGILLTVLGITWLGEVYQDHVVSAAITKIESKPVFTKEVIPVSGGWIVCVQETEDSDYQYYSVHDPNHVSRKELEGLGK